MAVLHLVLMFAAPFAVSALVAIALSSLVAWRSARFAHTAADGAIRGELVVKKGRARSRWRSSSTYGLRNLTLIESDLATLAIKTSDGEVELEGPFEIKLGSRAAWTREKRIEGGHVVAMMLEAGDRVVATGRIVEVAGSETDYRAKATHTKLEPLSSGASITLRSEARPRARIEGLARRLAVIFPALPFFWLPLGAIQDWSNVDTTKCAELGTCHAIPIWRTDAPFLTVVKGWWHGDHYKSGPSSDANCAATTACSQYGQCHAVDGQCQAKGDGDCQASWQCMQYGNCSDNAGRCAALKDEDCARTEMCWNFGACTADASRGCTIGKDSDCARTEQCTKWGQCSAVNHDCKAVKDSDCRQGEVCRDGPRCTASGGECVATDASCHETYDCMTSGNCATSGGTSAFCVPKTDDDCQWSRACIEYGECTAYQRICAIDTLRCSESAQCFAQGNCGGDQPYCKPRSDRDCEASLGCKEHGACKLIDGRCRKSCADHIDCKLDGRCTFDNNRCVVGGDADCAQSLGCARDGLCTRGSDGRCIATRNEDCIKTHYCREIGNCTAKDGRCARTSDADCRLSNGCRDLGYCFAAADGGICERKSVAGGCKDTTACKRAGLCSVDEKAGCVVKNDDDCKESDVCKQYGWCKAVERHTTYDHATRCFTSAPR